MSTTLNLADRLLAMGRNFQSLGREHDALHILNRLAALHDLPAEVAEETQSRLVEIYLRWRRFTRARRHLTTLLQQYPQSARYHALMAEALHGDERSSPARVAEHLRQSLSLDPNQPACLGELGLLQLRDGQSEEGLANLRRAAELAPDDPTVVGRLAEGLRQEGLAEEARSVLRAALFRNARDGRFRKLWNDFQFQQLRAEQEAGRPDLDRPVIGEGAPRVLPFLRPVGGAAVGRKLIRRDRASGTPAPHLRPTVPLPDKKHA